MGMYGDHVMSLRPTFQIEEDQTGQKGKAFLTCVCVCMFLCLERWGQIDITEYMVLMYDIKM